MSLQTPYSLLEAEIGLYQAAADSAGSIDPATEPVHIGSCPANLEISIDQSEEDPRAFADPIGLHHITDTDYQIDVEFLHGQYLADAALIQHLGDLRSRYILTVLWHDRETGHWTKYQFYDVTVPRRNIGTQGDDSEHHTKPISFHARRAEDLSGNTKGVPATATHAAIPATPAPPLAPEFIGYLVYRSPGSSFAAYTYNFDTQTWTALPQNLSAINSRLVIDLQSNQIDIRDVPGATWSTALTWDTVAETATLKAGGEILIHGADPHPPTVFGSKESIWIKFIARGITYFSLGYNGNLLIPGLTDGEGPLSPVPANAASLPGDVLTFLPKELHVDNTILES